MIAFLTVFLILGALLGLLHPHARRYRRDRRMGRALVRYALRSAR